MQMHTHSSQFKTAITSQSSSSSASTEADDTETAELYSWCIEKVKRADQIAAVSLPPSWSDCDKQNRSIVMVGLAKCFVDSKIIVFVYGAASSNFKSFESSFGIKLSAERTADECLEAIRQVYDTYGPLVKQTQLPSIAVSVVASAGSPVRQRSLSVQPQPQIPQNQTQNTLVELQIQQLKQSLEAEKKKTAELTKQLEILQLHSSTSTTDDDLTRKLKAQEEKYKHEVDDLKNKLKEIDDRRKEAVRRAQKAERRLLWLPDFDPRDPRSMHQIKLLGKSQFEVYQVEITDPVVMKVCNTSGKPLQLAMKKLVLPRDKPKQQKLLRELEMHKECLHDNLLPLLYAKIYEFELYLFMPVMHKDLQAFINDESAFPDETSYRLNLPSIVLGMARGLNHLHTGLEKRIVHCDVKPANVLLCMEAVDNGIVKVTEVRISDMGGAKAEHTMMQAISSAGVHSYHYSAPEQKVNMQDKTTSMLVQVDHKADTYAFGICLGELLVRETHRMDMVAPDIELFGREWNVPYHPRLFSDDDLRDRGHATDVLVHLYRDCTQADPAARPEMSEVLRRLEEAGDSAFVPFDPSVAKDAVKFQQTSTRSDSFLVPMSSSPAVSSVAFFGTPNSTPQDTSLVASLSAVESPLDNMKVQDVCDWLMSLFPDALEAAAMYAKNFVANDIDGLALRDLTDVDLKNDLAVRSLGHRKHILAKVADMKAGSMVYK